MENQDYEELENEQQTKNNGNAAVGVSTAVGATAGIIGGNFISGKVNAAEPEEAEEATDNEEQAQAEAAKTASNTASSHSTVQPQAQTPEPVATPEPSPEAETPAPEPQPAVPDVQIVDYQTVVNDNGTPVDVAVLTVDGHQGVAVDYNQTGEIDVVAVDLNDNDQLDNGEAAYVADQHIPMEPLREAFEDSSLNDVAQDDGGDYVNDGDVDAYMA